MTPPTVKNSAAFFTIVPAWGDRASMREGKTLPLQHDTYLYAKIKNSQKVSPLIHKSFRKIVHPQERERGNDLSKINPHIHESRSNVTPKMEKEAGKGRTTRRSRSARMGTFVAAKKTTPLRPSRSKADKSAAKRTTPPQSLQESRFPRCVVSGATDFRSRPEVGEKVRGENFSVHNFIP